MATDETLKQALEVLSGVFDTLGFEVKANSVNITSRELAEEYRFISSPTIRVNGVDICSELVESNCADCGDLCGDSMDCRVFLYEGKEYEQPPVPMSCGRYPKGHLWRAASIRRNLYATG